jgi:hypothetical protein
MPPAFHRKQSISQRRLTGTFEDDDAMMSQRTATMNRSSALTQCFSNALMNMSEFSVNSLLGVNRVPTA